jgi:gas vesicle protein
MNIITIVSLILASVIAPIVSWIVAGKTSKRETRKAIRKDAKEEQKLKDVIEGLMSDVEMLKEHRETTMLTLVKIETNLTNLDSKVSELHTMNAEIRTILINRK